MKLSNMNRFFLLYALVLLPVALCAQPFTIQPTYGGVEFVYDEVGEMQEGIMQVYANKTSDVLIYGVVDCKTGKEIIPVKYERVSYNRGTAIVMEGSTPALSRPRAS